MTPVFDTLRIAQLLKEAGFDDRQSEAVVTAIRQSLTENVATKGDLDAGLANLRADMYRAMLIQTGSILLAVLGVGGGILAAVPRFGCSRNPRENPPTGGFCLTLARLDDHRLTEREFS